MAHKCLFVVLVIATFLPIGVICDDNVLDNSLDWLTRLYNPRTLNNFTADGVNVSSSCAQDMNLYLTALDQEKLWAAKLMDSSGRYTPQFFYGNNYWLGSMSLCSQLTEAHLKTNAPPFPVSFRVARLLLKMQNLTTPQGQLVFLGVCLPVSCTVEDVSYILSSSYELSVSTGKASITVLRVRPVPGDYSLFTDKRFFALGGTTLLVAFLMLVGTLFECILKQRRNRKLNVEGAQGTNSKPEDASTDVENNNSNRKLPVEEKSSKGSICEVKVEGDQPVKEQKGKQNGSLQVVPEKERTEKSKGIFSEFLLSFSVFSNASKILNCSRGSEGSLNSVHGLRFFSLAWVIFVHTYLQIFAIGENKALRAQTEKKFIYQTVGNATYSVDSFFLISGLLVSYMYFKNASERSKKTPDTFGAMAVKFATLLLYRFIRLTPVYIVVLGLVHLTMTVLKDTSVFETPLIVDLNCEHYWWRNLLYVNNLFPRREMCMLWSWYMAVDTQFFVLSAILLLLASRYFKFSVASLFTIVICSWFTTAFISYTNQYQVRVEEPFALFDELYDKPWTRIGPYIAGMCAGWYLQYTNVKIKMHLIVVFLGWICSISCLLALVYGIQGGLDITLSSVYASLGHTAWGVCLAWIVIACSSGYGGWIDSILSCPAFYPLSRLTYCAYLVHPVIMFLTNYVMDGAFHMHNGVIVIIFLGNLVASFMLSFILSLAFEAPFVRLLKLLMSPSKNR